MTYYLIEKRITIGRQERTKNGISRRRVRYIKNDYIQKKYYTYFPVYVYIAQNKNVKFCFGKCDVS